MPQGLGRGLGSLIPKKTVTYGQNPFKTNTTEEEIVVLQDGDRILKINPDRISINPQQPRTHFSEIALNDLAESIKQHGIIQPLIVTKKLDLAVLSIEFMGLIIPNSALQVTDYG